VEALRLHPGGRRILIQSSSPVSPLIMSDLKQGTVMQEYRLDRGAGRKPKFGSCVTPCGSFVLAGGRGPGDRPCVHVWDTDTAVQRHLFPVADYLQDAHVVRFHPQDHMVVFGALVGVNKEINAACPTLVYKYVKESSNVVAAK